MDNAPHSLSREELLIGKEGIDKLHSASVALFGIGGVGSFAAEALARSGIGRIALIDGDTVSITNINRQLIALRSTIGMPKTLVMAERIRDIRPLTDVETYPIFYTAENKDIIDFKKYDYIIDAIDMVSSKLLIIEEAKKADVPVISCMGTGNKLDPSHFEIADIEKTSVCPLAKVMRKQLKARGIRGVKAVYSKEEPISPPPLRDDGKKQSPGSISFVPPVAGMLLAGEVIRSILGIERAQ